MEQAAAQAAAGRTADDWALRDLVHHWGDAYLIGHDGEHGWWASRRDEIGSLLTAADAEGLRELIRADYAARPVPRVLPASPEGRP